MVKEARMYRALDALNAISKNNYWVDIKGKSFYEFSLYSGMTGNVEKSRWMVIDAETADEMANIIIGINSALTNETI